MPYSHLALARRHITPHGRLYVVTPCFNPLRYASRYSLLRDFVKHANCAGAEIYVAEAAFGNRPFEVEKLCEAHNLQFRVRDEFWIKESLINATVARLPLDWEYVAWVDADVTFVNPDWVQETIQQLQHFDIVQMWHDAIDLDPNGRQMDKFTGFIASKLAGLPDPKEKCGDYYYGAQKAWHPGFAWACRRSAWDTLGGLLDINIVGGGDFQMAYALFGEVAGRIPPATDSYRHAILTWQEHAKLLKSNVGFVPGTIVHHWHGKKSRRGYINRWQILANNKFDPTVDLKRDSFGLWQLAGNKPKLRDDLRAYFRSRNEDGIDV